MKKILLLSRKNNAIALGDEIIENGGFDTDTANWGKGSGWTISGGTAQITSASSNQSLTQSDNINFSGYPKKYRVEIDVNSLSGTLWIFIGGTIYFAITETGHNVTDIEITSGNAVLYIMALNGTSTEIDNISVKEIL